MAAAGPYHDIATPEIPSDSFSQALFERLKEETRVEAMQIIEKNKEFLVAYA